MGADAIPRFRRTRYDIMILSRAGRLTSVLFKFAPAAILLAVLAWQLLSYGPTLDPDPDGYISYAEGLLETGELQSHRRLPGYPALIALVEALAPGSISLHMFWLHAGLILAFALASTLLIQRYIGYGTSLIYLAILAINSYFARATIFMLADLPSVLLFYGTIAAGLGFLTREGATRWMCLAVAIAAMILNFAVHSASAMLLQILIWISVALLLLHVARVGDKPQAGPLSRRATRSTIASLVALSVLAYGAETSVKSLLQRPHDQRFIEYPVPLPDKPDAVTNSETFYRSWLAYRIILCLPPSKEPSSLDQAIEDTKSAVGNRLGYSTDAVVPPAFAPEFLALIQKVDITLDLSRERLRAHPVDFIGCALKEMRAKWYFLLRNLTPFTTLEGDKTWMSPAYPATSRGLAERIFWSTGLYLAEALATDPPPSSVWQQAFIEIARVIAVIISIIGGLVLIDRRWPLVGMIAGLSMIVWFLLLSCALPVETRYFIPFFPLLYMGQALLIERLAKRIRYPKEEAI